MNSDHLKHNNPEKRNQEETATDGKATQHKQLWWTQILKDVSKDTSNCPLSGQTQREGLTKQNEPELVKMQELGEECLKPICKAVRRIREEVGPHGDRGCKLQKQQNGGMLTSNMFHLSVFLSRSLLFRLEQAQQVHTHEKETSSPRTTYNHPRVTGLKDAHLRRITPQDAQTRCRWFQNHGWFWDGQCPAFWHHAFPQHHCAPGTRLNTWGFKGFTV